MDRAPTAADSLAVAAAELAIPPANARLISGPATGKCVGCLRHTIKIMRSRG